MADELNSHRHRRSRSQRPQRDLSRPLALALFAVLITLGPLVFGSVDRVVQIGFTVVLGVGMLIFPPRLIALPVWLSRLLVGLATILVVKELAPAGLFGAMAWRETLERAYELPLPWTHHPEPGRAFDGWLAGMVGAGWFAWVRTLAVDRDDRTRLAWIMFAGAALVAVISFATVGMGGPNSQLIFGLRYTPGWFGFGPFPNRNHSACYFAMAAIIGAGCLARSGERKRFGLLVVAVLMLGGVLLALLRTQSRGGILAMGVGFAVFFGVVLLKLRSRQALAVTLAAGLLVGGLGLLAGGKALQRIAGTGAAADDSAAARVAVWKNATVMWKDAPLLGHGLGTFASVFPMYQQMAMEEIRVKHPESSWLQWLNELGFVPVMLSVVAGLAFCLPSVGALFERRSSFYIRAAGFGVAATLLTHAVFDVPAHRWGTAGFALAALALACPALPEARRAPRLAGAVPLGIAGFWLLPLMFDQPAWSTFQLERVLASQPVPPGLPVSEIDRTLRCFPLNAQLHFARGERLLRAGTLPPSRWQNDFRLAARLLPNSWEVCVRAARLCRLEQPSLSLHYWQRAVERATRQRGEVFGRALQETASIPGAMEVWSNYAETHADVALMLAESLPGDDGKRFYEAWWEKRGATVAEISEAEATAFIRVAARWGTMSHLALWMQRHPERADEDFRGWASLLHTWGEDEKAWGILSQGIKEPAYPTAVTKQKKEDVGFLWRHNPEDIVNARTYAQLLESQGEIEESEQVVASVAGRVNAPLWFQEKAAHQLARHQQFGKAVEILLRVPVGPAAAPAAATPSQ